jgi:hypothetical protein
MQAERSTAAIETAGQASEVNTATIEPDGMLPPQRLKE